MHGRMKHWGNAVRGHCQPTTMPSRTAKQQRSPANGKHTTSGVETTAAALWLQNHGKRSGTRTARVVDKNA
eukprot:11217182-Lingulodinium_polyedra.AAC.1